jgi:hypothetical protein
MARFGVFLCVLGLALVASIAAADDIKAKVTAVDLDKRTIDVTVDDKDQSFDVSPSAKVYRLTGNNVKRSGYAELPGGLKEVAADEMVTLTTDFIDGKEQVIRIKIETAAKKGRHLGRDISGKVAEVDSEKRLIVLGSGDSKQQYALDRNCNVFKLVGGGARAHYDLAPDGLADVKVGAEVTINVVSRDGKEQVDYIQIGPPRKPKSK